MNSHFNSQKILEALGDKVIESLGAAVFNARHDLKSYRLAFPEFAADASERGLANWIHDRLWAHLTSSLQDSGIAEFVDSGPTRELLVDGIYRIRIKRHDGHGRVSSYPTTAATTFFEQLSLELRLGSETEVRLAAGYRWVPEAREIGPAVLSYRDGVENLVWMVELPEPSQTGHVTSIAGSPTPPPAEISLPAVDGLSEAIQE